MSHLQLGHRWRRITRRNPRAAKAHQIAALVRIAYRRAEWSYLDFTIAYRTKVRKTSLPLVALTFVSYVSPASNAGSHRPRSTYARLHDTPSNQTFRSMFRQCAPAWIDRPNRSVDRRSRQWCRVVRSWSLSPKRSRICLTFIQPE